MQANANVALCCENTLVVREKHGLAWESWTLTSTSSAHSVTEYSASTVDATTSREGGFTFDDGLGDRLGQLIIAILSGDYEE